MKKSQLINSMLALAVLGLLTGCGKQEAQKPKEQAAPVPAFTSADKTSFQEVTSRLDAGGAFYMYLSTEQMLSGLSGKISHWRQVFTSMPDTDAQEREQIGKVFDVVTDLVKDSGLEDVSGFGMSSIATEKGSYRSKTILHHYPNHGTGLLWKMCGQQPHALTGQDLLPATTALALFSDGDVPLVWMEIQKLVARTGIPQAQAFMGMLPVQFEQATGLKWDQVLNSLGGEFGMVLTLDEARQIPIPLPTSEKFEIPEPGLMFLVKVKDDTIFNRIDQALTTSGQQIVRVDKADLKMRTVSLPLPLPIQLRPSIASCAGYLILATTDTLIQEALAVKSGQKPGLKAGDEFKRLARDIPQQGNQFTFLSRRFGAALQKIQRQALELSAKAQPAQEQWLQSFLSADQELFAYSVGVNTPEGWLSVSQDNQRPGQLLLAAAVAPVGLLAAIAVPSFINAREKSIASSCINNLRQIESAKDQYALDHTNAAPTSLSDLVGPNAYIKKMPVCRGGGSYTLHALGENPTCSVGGLHVLP